MSSVWLTEILETFPQAFWSEKSRIIENGGKDKYTSPLFTGEEFCVLLFEQLRPIYIVVITGRLFILYKPIYHTVSHPVFHFPDDHRGVCFLGPYTELSEIHLAGTMF